MMRSGSAESLGESTTVLIRAPSSVALNLETRAATAAQLLPESRPRLLSEIGSREGERVELLPVRAHVDGSLCRACGMCVEVCPFDAIEPGNASTVGDSARIEPALCRGCNLCVGVCPTGAAQPTALSPVWWGSRLDDAFRVADPFVVLACQRRAGALESSLLQHGAHIEVIRFRCVGQIDAGMLLDLKRLGARAVLVAGCSSERCRFDTGARLAAEQTEWARSMIEHLGGDPSCLKSDWSGDRGSDRLELPILDLVAANLKPGPTDVEPVSH